MTDKIKKTVHKLELSASDSEYPDIDDDPAWDDIKGPYPHIPDDLPPLTTNGRHRTQPNGRTEATEWALNLIQATNTKTFRDTASGDAMAGRVSPRMTVHRSKLATGP